MQVKRALLLSVLEAAEPALGSSRNQVQGLSHFWFDGATVVAFNDILGIRVKFQADFKGAVEGERLLGILKNSDSRGDVTLTAENTDLVMELGRTKVRLPLLSPEDRLFNELFPGEEPFVVDQKFIDALDLVLLSCGSKKIAAPAERGITLIAGNGGIDAYATDDVTFSWMHIPTKGGLFTGNAKRAIWPKEFCEYFVRIVKPNFEVVVTQDAVYCIGDIPIIDPDNKADTTYAELMVFSKLVDDEEPADFGIAAKRFAPAIDAGFEVPLVPFKAALERATVMLPAEQPIDLTLKQTKRGNGSLGGLLELSSNNALGEYNDKVTISGDVPEFDPLSVKVSVPLLKRCIDGRDLMALTEDSVVFSGPEGFYHFVSTRN